MIANINGASNVSRTKDYSVPLVRNINLRGASRPGDDEMAFGSLKFCDLGYPLFRSSSCMYVLATNRR